MKIGKAAEMGKISNFHEKCAILRKQEDTEMVERKEYLDQLWAWKDEQQIKVVTGIRRCGAYRTTMIRLF